MGIIETLQAIAYIIACYAFGRICMRGWRKHLNFLVDLVFSLSLGFIALSISPIFKTFIPFDIFIITDLIAALIASALIALGLFLISSGFVEKPITKKDLRKIIEEVEKLKEEVKKIKEVLAEKKILPKRLGREKILKNLGEILKEKGIKKFEILKEVEKINEWEFSIKSERKRYLARIDAYSGKLLELSEQKSEIIEKLKLISKNKLALAGIIFLLIVLAVLPTLYWKEISENLFSQFKLIGVIGEKCNETCPSMNCLLNLMESGKIKDEDITLAVGMEDPETLSKVIEAINSTENDNAIILASVDYGNSTYWVVISLTSQQKEDFMKMVMVQGLPGLLDYLMKNLQEFQKIEVCSLAYRVERFEKCGCEKLPIVLPKLLPLIQGKLSQLGVV